MKVEGEDIRYSMRQRNHKFLGKSRNNLGDLTKNCRNRCGCPRRSQQTVWFARFPGIITKAEFTVGALDFLSERR
jgi:hypothetical protein